MTRRGRWSLANSERNTGGSAPVKGLQRVRRMTKYGLARLALWRPRRSVTSQPANQQENNPLMYAESRLLYVVWEKEHYCRACSLLLWLPLLERRFLRFWCLDQIKCPLVSSFVIFNKTNPIIYFSRCRLIPLALVAVRAERNLRLVDKVLSSFLCCSFFCFCFFISPSLEAIIFNRDT